MIKRQVFYSFHYDADNWRAGQVRNIGTIEGNRPAPDNDWESVKRGGDPAIRKWIDGQMMYRSCTVVLIGSATYGRKWINYEIEKSWSEKMGLVGIYIHGLKDSVGFQSQQGQNPFSYFSLNGTPLNQIIRSYNTPHSDSTDVYAYIAANISRWVDEAIQIRGRY